MNEPIEASVWNRITENVQLNARMYARNTVGDLVWTDVKHSVYNFVADYFKNEK
jgi:hypothetical protein